jgi:hypothetical protein
MAEPATTWGLAICCGLKSLMSLSQSGSLILFCIEPCKSRSYPWPWSRCYQSSITGRKLELREGLVSEQSPTLSSSPLHCGVWNCWVSERYLKVLTAMHALFSGMGWSDLAYFYDMDLSLTNSRSLWFHIKEENLVFRVHCYGLVCLFKIPKLKS